MRPRGRRVRRKGWWIKRRKDTYVRCQQERQIAVAAVRWYMTRSPEAWRILVERLKEEVEHHGDV